MVENTRAVRLAGMTIEPYSHVCGFFHNREEWYQVLLPFIKEGIENGDKAFHIVDPRGRADHFQRLRQAGMDAEELERQGQLEVRTWYEAYLRNGHFDQDAMLALAQEVLNAGHAQGFPRTRLVADMEWALEDRPGVDDILEYETRVNYILSQYPDPVV